MTPATPAPPTETEKARPLSEDEKRVLRDLMSRENAWAGPATRIGEPYVALVNLSVPRRGDVNRQADLVHAGETVYLTEEEARQFNRRGPGTGRQVDVVRKLSGPDGSREPAQRVLPRDVSGRLFQPSPPPPGSDAPRPDPEGSSRIQVIEDSVPEAQGSQVPEAQEMAGSMTSPPVLDAVDLPPSRQRQRTHGGR